MIAPPTIIVHSIPDACGFKSSKPSKDKLKIVYRLFDFITNNPDMFKTKKENIERFLHTCIKKLAEIKLEKGFSERKARHYEQLLNQFKDFNL